MATALLDQARTHPTIPAQRSPRPSRERFIDLLRAAAILTIVCLHWLMPAISYDDGVLSTSNALATGSSWAITWIAQVMPLVFFAGGVPAQPVETASALVGRLLWFLAAYVLLIAITPALLRLHDRLSGGAVAVLAAGAVAVDAIRFGWLDGATWVGYPNVLLVWGTIYLAGVHYGRGSRARPRHALALAGAGMLATALAVAAGPYPASMIGMPGSEMSNMNPPTAVLLSVAAIQGPRPRRAGRPPGRHRRHARRA